MDWTAVDSQADLDQLDRSICWEDSEAVRFHGSPLNRADYPADVSRSGFVNKNVHVVIDTCSSHADEITDAE